VGTTALNGPVLEGLRQRNAGLISEKDGLRAQVEALRGDVGTADELVRALAGELVGGTLSGRGVLLVAAPDAEGGVLDELAATVEAAGGTVTGRLQLLPALFEPGAFQLVEDLASQVVPAGVELPDDGPLPRAGSLLGAALLDRPGGAAVGPDAGQAVVSAFSEAGLVELSGVEGTLTPATLAVLVAAPAPAPEEQDALARSAVDGMLALLVELRARASGLVVAGPSQSNVEGGLVRAVRSDPAADSLVSTVDNVDRGVGQVAAVLALAEQAAGGSGRYGGGQGATGAVPTGEAAEPEAETEVEPDAELVPEQEPAPTG
jgi:hypothetical protein